MSKGSISGALHYLRQLLGETTSTELADSTLLQRYAAHQDEAAFTALVQRHGPLVQRVCRQLALQAHDADDAFQATFLVLARKAGSIRRRESLAGWLYRVASNIALQARIRAVRRQKHERQVAIVESLDPLDPVERQELTLKVHEEVNRLPDRYRLPVLLCYLGDRTNEEAARELGLPPGTLKTRLLQARELLHKRLALRGVSLSAGALPALLVGEASAAALQVAAVQTTVQAALRFTAGQTSEALSAPAISLAKGALKNMWLTKCKFLAVAFSLVGLVSLGTGALVYQSAGGTAPGSQAAPPQGEAAPERTDSQGDPLPAGALARIGTTRWRLPGSADFLRFLPDGKRLLTVSGDRSCQVWELASGRVLHGFDLGEPNRAWPGNSTLSPDGRTLTRLDQDQGKLALWDVETGKKRTEVPVARASRGPVIFAADGNSLFTADPFDKGRVQQWETASGRELRRFDIPPAAGSDVHQVVQYHLLQSADGQVLMTFAVCQLRDIKTYRAQVILWDPKTGKQQRVLSGVGSKGWVEAVALSPDGQRLAWGWKGQLRLHDLKTDRELFQLDAQLPAGAQVAGCLFSPDSKVLTTQLADGVLLFWDCETGKRLPLPAETLRGPSPFGFAPDGKSLAVASGHMIRLLDVATGKPLPIPGGHSFDVRALLVSPDGQEVITHEGTGRPLRWEVATGKSLPLPVQDVEEKRIIVSADGRTAAVFQDANRIDLLAAQSGEKISTLTLPNLVHPGPPPRRTPADGLDGSWTGLRFAADGRMVVTRGRDRQSLLVWQVADGKQLRELRVQRKSLVNNIGSGEIIPGFGIRDACLLPDGATVALYFWGHYSHPLAPQGDADPRRDELVFFSIETGQELFSFRVPEAQGWGASGGLVPAPNGHVVVVSNGADGIFLVEQASGKQRARLQGAGDCLAFTPDGRVLAAAGADATVRLWDLITGKALGQFIGHRGAVRSLAFTPDGRKLISGSADTTALVWDAASSIEKGKVPAVDLTAQQVATLWNELAGDPATAYRAMQTLHTAPKQAVPALVERVGPLAAAEARQIEQWLGDLGSSEFTVRDRATAELEKHGEQALPVLNKALEAKPDLEVRTRLTRLIELISTRRMSGEALRCLRAVEVLETLDPVAARRALEKLARGSPDAPLTKEARANLERLNR